MTRLFEDGFETGDLSKWTSQSKTAGETIAVATINPFQGAYHADFETDGVEAGESAYITKDTPSYKECFVRLYIKFLKALPAAGKVYLPLNIRTKVASGGALCYVDVAVVAGIPVWRLYWVDSIDTYVTSTTIPVVLNKWYCIEVHVKVGTTDGRYEFWVDGTKLVDITGKDNQTTYGPVNFVQVGERWSSAQVAHGVYVDEFVIADQYVGPFLPHCFIATAAFGSPLAPQLSILRRFRDRCLPDRLVQFYYNTSPPIAGYIREHFNVKRAVRAVLDVLVKLLKRLR